MRTARQDDRIVIAQRRFFVPNIIGLKARDAVNARDAILITIRAGKLNDRELHVDLMGDATSALFLMIVIHHERGMDYSRNPAEQSQKDAKKKTGDPARHQHRQRRQDDAKKVSQRLHLDLLLFCFVLVCPPSGFCSS